jgi:hypothetical protein
MAAPALAGEGAYIPGRGSKLLAVGPAGQVRWQFVAQQAGAWLDKTPLVVGERLFAVLNLAGAVAALGAADGALLWQTSLGPPGSPLTPPVSDGQRLYLGSRAGLYALDLADGRELWRRPVERGLEAGPVVAGDVVYAAGRDHRLYALEAATGRVWWQYAVERRLETPPLITAGPQPLALIVDQGGTVVAVARPLSPVEEAARQVEAAATPLVSPHDPAVIRQLLQAVFTDETLTIFCFDHFQPVYARFNPGLPLAAKSSALVKYCQANQRLDKLLALVKQTYPQPYQNFKPARPVDEVDLAGDELEAPLEPEGDTLIQGYREIHKTLRQNLVRVERQMAEFVDEAAVPLDLIRSRDSLLKRIAETEAKIEAETEKKSLAKAQRRKGVKD